LSFGVCGGEGCEGEAVELVHVDVRCHESRSYFERHLSLEDLVCVSHCLKQQSSIRILFVCTTYVLELNSTLYYILEVAHQRVNLIIRAKLKPLQYSPIVPLRILIEKVLQVSRIHEVAIGRTQSEIGNGLLLGQRCFIRFLLDIGHVVGEFTVEVDVVRV
jgi:hypothetical protein